MLTCTVRTSIITMTLPREMCSTVRSMYQGTLDNTCGRGEEGGWEGRWTNGENMKGKGRWEVGVKRMGMSGIREERRREWGREGVGLGRKEVEVGKEGDWGGGRSRRRVGGERGRLRRKEGRGMSGIREER